MGNSTGTPMAMLASLRLWMVVTQVLLRTGFFQDTGPSGHLELSSHAVFCCSMPHHVLGVLPKDGLCPD